MNHFKHLIFILCLLFPHSIRSQSTSVISYPKVGGCGSYNKVTTMLPGVWPNCPSSPPACQQAATTVGGRLSPFDEEISVIVRGPMNIYNFAVYQPSTTDETQAWNKVSSYTKTSPSSATNFVTMNNNGGGASGVWTICAGASQSYSNATGDGAASGPTPFNGYLPNKGTVNFMTSSPCGAPSTSAGDATTSCGFYRGVGMHGWKGNTAGAKAFAIEVDMPAYSSCAGELGYCNAPAIWVLNANILRTAQWACNCRGVGGDGGCGELDVAEVVPSGSDANQINLCSSTLYTYHGSKGSGTWYFPRPYTTSKVFIVIFSATNDKIQEIMVDKTAFDFTTGSLTGTQIANYLAMTGANIQLDNYNTACYNTVPGGPTSPPATQPTPAPATPPPTPKPTSSPPPASCTTGVKYARCWGLSANSASSSSACATACCVTNSKTCTTWSWGIGAGCYLGKATSCGTDLTNSSGAATWTSGGAVALKSETESESAAMTWFKTQGYWIMLIVILLLVLIVLVLVFTLKRRQRGNSYARESVAVEKDKSPEQSAPIALTATSSAVDLDVAPTQDAPLDVSPLSAAPTGSDWELRTDETGKEYYYNNSTGQSQWEKPE